ncbi:hypothetical protein RRV45_21835 [Bacillus sp. DTU_2020_1000418_1_SI_GHA_SEK_038]|nr:hypothetical protein [Bacillus sp. DTU_2020_1000418_1_SI_GHA_SEK_038]WNS75474.1 hypothetical protein RRV45_21835 [Bacillus sp. DTU_2020_1000418_1_SI_GHA_SEK_038]
MAFLKVYMNIEKTFKPLSNSDQVSGVVTVAHRLALGEYTTGIVLPLHSCK